MTRATLTEVLQAAQAGGYAVPGLVCLGWEDARAYAMAAEAESAPLILQAGPGARAHMPVAVFGAMFRHLADMVRVPVVAHLDHGQTVEEVRAAIAAGFTSVMFDGSRLPLDQNIADTSAMVQIAHAAGVSCEGEIGFVGYASGAESIGTDPLEAARFAVETGVDAMAVSVGNVHLQQDQTGGLDLPRLAAIRGACTVPLVIHGGSGVPLAQRRELALTGQVAKFNIGTELRMTFGAALRQAITADPTRFDRIALLSETHAPLMQATRAILQNLNASGQA